jgi:hypothetical protein
MFKRWLPTIPPISTKRTTTSHWKLKQHPNKQFNLATCLCLFQARTWISNVICSGCFNFQWEVVVRFVDIGGIVGNHRLNILFTVLLVLSENSLFHRFKLHPRYHIMDNIINKGWKVKHTDRNKNKSQTWLKLKLHFHKYAEPLHMTLEIQVLAWNRHKHVARLNCLLGSQPMFLYSYWRN